MDDDKRQLSEWLNIELANLNEIALEDVEFEPSAQQNINNAVIQLLALDNKVKPPVRPVTYETEAIPCKGYWIEPTKDLVVYIRFGEQLKALIVPNGSWDVRDDITIN